MEARARGAIFGLTRGTTRAHVVRAALEALAYQVDDLCAAMSTDAGVVLQELNVDGGACANSFLMQFQSGILDARIRRPKNTETTALGAAYLAGLTAGFWSSADELLEMRSKDDVFASSMDEERREKLLAGWHEAVRRTV